MLDDKLKEIIEGKDIKNFWELFEYLHVSGYEYIDSVGIALNFFTETQIWQDVAFARFEKVQKEEQFNVMGVDPVHPPDAHDWYAGNDHGVMNHQGTRIREFSILRVGIITEENKHMRGLYGHYMKAIAEGRLEYNDHQIMEIERTCKIIYEFSQLPTLVVGYLGDVGDRYYGFKPMTKINDPNDDERARLEMMQALTRNDEFRGRFR